MDFLSSGQIYLTSLAFNQSSYALNGITTAAIISQLVVTTDVRNQFQSFYANANLTNYCQYTNVSCTSSNN